MSKKETIMQLIHRINREIAIANEDYLEALGDSDGESYFRGRIDAYELVQSILHIALYRDERKQDNEKY